MISLSVRGGDNKGVNQDSKVKVKVKFKLDCVWTVVKPKIWNRDKWEVNHVFLESRKRLTKG